MQIERRSSPAVERKARLRPHLFRLYKAIRNRLAATPLRKVLRVKALQDMLFRRLHPRYAEIEGRKMFLDDDDCMLLSLKGVYEPVTTRFVKEMVRPGDVVVDIGANIGYYTLLFSELTGPGGKVLAFEPHPANCALLRKNVEANGLANVEVFERAASNRSGKARLYLDRDGGAMYHSLIDLGERTSFLDVDCVRLDDFLAGREGHLDIIKIDVEGGEGLALEGMGRILETNRRLRIISEFSPEALRTAGTEPAEHLRKIQAMGFEVRALDGTFREIRPSDIEGLLDSYLNLLFTRDR